MTKKRFINVGNDIFQYGEWYCSAGGEHCADVIATALNQLIEENEQLKKELDCFKPLIFETDGIPITLYEKKVGVSGMMLQIGDDGVVSSVNEEDLIHVDKKELEQFIESYQKLEKENEQLKSNVIDLIDKKINKLKNINEVSLIPRESVEILKELKKELEE